MIELPMSDTEAEMQAEFEAEDCKSLFPVFGFSSFYTIQPILMTMQLFAADVFSAFNRRISSHAFQLQKLLMSISGFLEKSFSHEPTNDSKFVRDYFNLHKIILVITKQLKVSTEFLIILIAVLYVVIDFVC